MASWSTGSGPRTRGSTASARASFSSTRTISRGCASTASSRRSSRSPGPATAPSPSARTRFASVCGRGTFGGLLTTRDYEQERWFVNFSTDVQQTFGFSVSYDQGTVINLVPPLGVAPELADRAYIEGELRWRPIDRLRIDAHVPLDELGRPGNRRPDFRRPHLPHARQLSVHQGDVAARHPPARGHAADRVVAPHARRELEPRPAVPLRAEPLVGACTSASTTTRATCSSSIRRKERRSCAARIWRATVSNCS